MRPNAEEARRRLADPPLLLVLPGSRASEIRRMAGVFGEARRRWSANRVGALEVVVPAVPRLADAVQAAVASWRVPARVVTDAGGKGRGLPHRAGGAHQVRHLDAGTGGRRRPDGRRLQGPAAGGAGRPPAGQGAESVILANLVLGENVVPEFLQRDCTPERLAAALLPLLSDTPERRRQIEAFAPARCDHGDRQGAAPATGPPPWFWIAAGSATNQRAKQWHPRPPTA